MIRLFLRASAIALLLAGVASADEPLFSGPQVGEKLSPFAAQAPFRDSEEVDVLDGAMDSPILIVFVHQITRPSVALTRLLMEFAGTKESAGLKSRLVFLTDDLTDTTAFLKRARHALPAGVSPLISTDGLEGPGTYGLNRNVTLTVLVGAQGVVTANFPLVQPSLPTDAPKIGHEIVKALGGSDAPTLQEMGYREPRMTMQREGQGEQDAIYRQMMAPVIQRTASAEEVATAAAKVEAYAAEHPWFRQRVHVASRLISEGPRLKDYGTPETQAYLKKWAKEFAPEKDERSNDEEPAPAAVERDRDSAESGIKSDDSTAEVP
jgi:hypothetical protein